LLPLFLHGKGGFAGMKKNGFTGGLISKRLIEDNQKKPKAAFSNAVPKALPRSKAPSRKTPSRSKFGCNATHEKHRPEKKTRFFPKPNGLVGGLP
jgi:hypothetical protein